jgi:phosphatidylserine synthase
MNEPVARPRPLSMILGFHLADLFTLGNAACGMASVFASMTYLLSGVVCRGDDFCFLRVSHYVLSLTG